MKTMMKTMVLSLFASPLLADLAVGQEAPACPLPNQNCPLTCVASPGIEADHGTGTPAEVAAMEADTDVSVTYDDGNGQSGNVKICNGTGKVAGDGCATCSMCWVSVNSSYNNHAGDPQYSSRINTHDWPSGMIPWNSLLTYGRSGYLNVNCGKSGYIRIEVSDDGGATILKTYGVTLICGCET